MILVTGATGKVGVATAQALQRFGVACRVFVRDEAKWSSKTNAEVVVGDLANDDDLRRAFSGVSKALLVMGNNAEQGQIEQNFAAVAASSGVQHLVKVSSMEASPEVTAALPLMHYQSEQFIVGLGVDYTFLRANYYMQNMFMSAAAIANGESFALPLGTTKTAMIDTRDLGEIAARALTQDGHAGKTYKLTGPELLDFSEVAAAFSKALGRPISYVDQPPEEFRAILSQFIHSDWHLNAVCELFEQIRGGALASQCDDAENILGRPPSDIHSFIADHLPAFRKAPSAN